MLGNLGSIAAGVLYQAWSDSGAGRVRGTCRAETEKDRHEAERFLTARHGPWADSRKHWSEIAGICPEQVRQRALAALGPQDTTVLPTPPAVKRIPRPGTKLKALVDSLSQPEGISLEEMMERFGWSRVTCSTAVSGDLPSKFGIRGKRGADGRYRLV